MIDVLNCFIDRPEPLSIAELSEKSRISVESVWQIIRILMEKGYVRYVADDFYPAYLTEFRSESVESTAAGVQIGQTPEQPYRHTAIWRFANSCLRSGAICACSRNFVRYAGYVLEPVMALI